MMLHRHFEKTQVDNITKRQDIFNERDVAAEQHISDIFPPDTAEIGEMAEPKRRGRPRKADFE